MKMLSFIVFCNDWSHGALLDTEMSNCTAKMMLLCMSQNLVLNMITVCTDPAVCRVTDVGKRGWINP